MSVVGLVWLARIRQLSSVMRSVATFCAANAVRMRACWLEIDQSAVLEHQREPASDLLRAKSDTRIRSSHRNIDRLAPNLSNPVRHACAVEAAYRIIWRRWCVVG